MKDMMLYRKVLERFYPEAAAGGFTRADGSVEFYGRINAIVASDMTVVDFGAGRGEWLEDEVAYRRDLRELRGKVQKVIAMDIDPAVRQNPACDEVLLCDEYGRSSLGDDSVDLVVADHVLEHISHPDIVSSELDRILRTDGWICARTPNKHGYIGIGARVIPNSAHVGLLRYLQPTRKAEDVFRTAYNLNTKKALKAYFPPEQYDHFVYAVTAEPVYSGYSRLAWYLFLAMAKLTPEPLGSKYMIFLRKRKERTNSSSA